MDDVQLVQVFNACNDLMEELQRKRLLNPLIFYNKIEKLATICILHDQIQLLGRFNDLIQLNDVWVPDHLQDVDFTGNTLDIVHVLYFIFFENFHGDSLICQIVNAKLYFSKSSFANRFTENVVADVLRTQIGRATVLKPAADFWITWFRLSSSFV